jgi:aminoglycoside phosphotransferase (APT) family kinase protein
MDTLGAELTPLDGGHTGETFLATGPEGHSVVRLYTGAGRRLGPDAANIDAALLHWVRGLLPVPEVLEVRRADAAMGLPAILVTSHLRGTRGDVVLASLGGEALRMAAKEIAKVLQRLSLVRTPRPGSFDSPGLKVGGPSDLWKGLEGFVEREGRSLTRGWSATERTALRRSVARAQELLDDDGVSCLVHGDFQPSNLLIDPESLVVVGLVDWEQARSGNRHVDLGRLLRERSEPAFEAALVEELDALDRALGLEPVNDRRERARAADLFALVEQASVHASHPEIDKARRLLRQLAT